jgi:hypothetical protein
LQLCGRGHYRATKKNLENGTQLDEPAECASGGDPLLLYRILHLLFSPLVYEFFVHYALRVKIPYENDLDAGPLEFQFVRPRGCLTNPFRTLSLCFEAIGKTPGIIPRNNFVKYILCDSAFAIMSWQDVTRSSLCSGVKECGTKRAHNFIFPKSSFRIRRTTVLGMFEDSAIILERMDRHF